MNMSIYNKLKMKFLKISQDVYLNSLWKSWLFLIKKSLRNDSRMFYYCFVLLQEANPVREDGWQEMINPMEYASTWIIRQQMVRFIVPNCSFY